MHIVRSLFYLELGHKFISELEKGKYTFDRRKEGEREGEGSVGWPELLE